MDPCNFPLDGRKNQRGHCVREAGHGGPCGSDLTCPDCGMLLPINGPGGRCDKCEFTTHGGIIPKPLSDHMKRDRILVDEVNSPAHYGMGNIECIDAIREMLGDGFQAYCRGQVLKYLWRAEYKGNTQQDYRKAQWYMNMLVGEDPRE